MPPPPSPLPWWGEGIGSMDAAQAPRSHEHEGVGGDHEAAEEDGKARVHRGGERTGEEPTQREEVPAERVEAHHAPAEMIRHVLLQIGADLHQVEGVAEAHDD